LKSSKNQDLGSDETKLGQGRDAVKSLIKDNPELADELEVIKRKNKRISRVKLKRVDFQLFFLKNQKCFSFYFIL
jgi:hypothetical protein